MNFLMDNESDLESEQHNLTISGPSKSSQKSTNEKILWDVDDIALGNSLVNLNRKKDVIAKRNKEEKNEKYKYKSNGMYKGKMNTSTKIKQLLSDRLKMYIAAEENARKTGEIKKLRQLTRKVQILNALIVHHDSGNIIDLDNIPPEIKTFNHGSKSTNSQLGVTFKDSTEITVIPGTYSNSDTGSEASLEKVLGTLRLRRDQYKISVAQNKSAGNVPQALEHLSIVKMFDSVIRHLEMGEKVDLNELPGPPECPFCHISSEVKNYRQANIQKPKENISETLIKQQISHSTILQELQVRLKFYKSSAKKESTDNVDQALRIERIIKIYKEAIKLHRAGKSFPIDELPSPPGFAPITNLNTPNKP